MKIAGIQFACSRDRENNLEKALRILDVAVREGAEIICFQEIFNLHWFPKDRDESAFELSEEVGGESVRVMQERSRTAGVVVLLPMFEKDSGKYYNSCHVIDGGKVAGVYRKVHIPDIPLWEEQYYFSPGGTDFPVFETTHGRIGVQISWDNLYPEGTRILALKGADIVFAPTACAFKSQHIWQTVLSGNAIANSVYLMRVNRVGPEDAQDFYGMSFVSNAEGELIGGPTGTGDSVLLAEVDFDYLKRIRREWPMRRWRKPSLYGELTRET
jgi:N-carbamoylputrescine amidase